MWSPPTGWTTLREGIHQERVRYRYRTYLFQLWGRDWVTGLSGCVTGCVYLVQDKVMGIQGSLRLRSQTGWRPTITDGSVVPVDAGEVM